MIHYEKCDPRGWDVGSGPMESMCGATTDRIKGRGRRWDLENAEAMMALEALYQSTGLWDRYWANAFRIRISILPEIGSAPEGGLRQQRR